MDKEEKVALRLIHKWQGIFRVILDNLERENNKKGDMHSRINAEMYAKVVEIQERLDTRKEQILQKKFDFNSHYNNSVA